MNTLVPVIIIGLGMPQSHGASSQQPVNAPWWPLVEQADVLVAGKQYLAHCAHLGAQKLAVTKDIEGLFATLQALHGQNKRIVMLASGDPLFFGVASKALQVFGASQCRCIPQVSSMQAAASLAGVPLQDMQPVSLHGRDGWNALGCALLQHRPLFVLCDAINSPAAIAEFCQQRGYAHSLSYVFENLCQTEFGEYASQLPVVALSLQQVQNLPAPAPHALQCMVILPEKEVACSPSLFGIDDDAFAKEKGLITKAPVRSVGLGLLQIAPWHTVWDIGAGSGAVSIEASRLAYNGQVFAIEQHPGRVEIIMRNRATYGAANLEIVTGSALTVLDDLPCPQRIFMGGGLGTNEEQGIALLQQAWERLAPQGRLVAHCVLLHSLERARHTLQALGAKVSITHMQISHSSPLGQDIRFEAANPVYLVCAIKE